MNKSEKIAVLKSGKVCTWHLFNVFTAPTEEQINNVVSKADCPLCKDMRID